ncbi:MAG: glycine--tRNA ligase [Anaerolineae bacterium]
MSQALSLQDVLLRLSEFWASYGCVIWQPYNIQVGAGTMNPATFLRVLGPEPWNVGYVEPSVRPDDGRFGDNPNRMQYYYQYQVILKPDPGNPQEVYLDSLAALGIDRRKHDIRFVEDNWKSPALGAWGLGWEVWLDGLEITQFTYFQQAGGQNLNPVSVEITYGVERILMALQGVKSVWDIRWTDDIRYGDVLLQSEKEHCHYYFNVADVDALREVYNTYDAEARRALAYDPPLVLPAHDYVLKCSHLFNVLDTRGAIGVTERAAYFKRMADLAKEVAAAYTAQRRALGYPLLPEGWEVDPETGVPGMPVPEPPQVQIGAYPAKPAPFLLEIGTEELPAADLDSAIAQLEESLPRLLDAARLVYKSLTVTGTPRRLVVVIDGLAPNQKAEDRILRGPPVQAAFDADGRPTRAAEGFARKNGVDVSALERREIEGGEYVVAVIRDEGRPAAEVLADLLPDLIAGLHFEQNMRWNWSGVSFSRPIRWLVSLYGAEIVPFSYAGLYAGRVTRGTRPLGSPDIELKDARDYFRQMKKQGIVVSRAERRALIEEQIAAAAASVGGQIANDPDLLEEVTNLVEQPTAVLGHFEEEFLALPVPVLTTVMKKHQRYFAVVDEQGGLLPFFVTVRNGDDRHLDLVAAGNEAVIRARFADARYFIQEDSKRPLADFLANLKTLTFQERLGSYYDKAARLEGLTARLCSSLGIDDAGLETAIRAARLAKADLVTQMVVEMTSLQGIMGREYALRSGEPPEVADAIAEHYLPRSTGDALPASPAGIAVALADRADSLVGLFAVGMAPTGSADPYALRRAALGLVQILIGHRLDLDLREMLGWAAQGLPEELRPQGEAVIPDLIDFIAGRLYGVLRESYAHDVVQAVLGAQAHNPYRAAVHAAQLAAWVERPDWSTILDAYARCARITRSQEQRFPVDPAHFVEPIEHELYAAYQQAATQVGPEADVDTFLTAFLPLVGPITVFFDRPEAGGVLVMHEDRRVRENRLGLLQGIVALAASAADLAALEGF